MSVIAEGVDTTEKMAYRCRRDLYQGYSISRPLTLEEIGIWAMQRSSRRRARWRSRRSGGVGLHFR